MKNLFCFKTYDQSPINADEQSNIHNDSFILKNLPDWYKQNGQAYIVFTLDSENILNETPAAKNDNIITHAVTTFVPQGEPIACESENQPIIAFPFSS